MKLSRQSLRLALLAVLVAVAVVTVVTRSSATGAIVKADLSGPWLLTLYGQGGCGVGTSAVTFTLNTAGTGTASTTSHSVGCGNTTATGDTFTINSLTTTGKGSAGLTCGVGCGFTFTIQVAPDRSSFTVVDLTDPNNFLIGTAVHQ